MRKTILCGLSLVVGFSLLAQKKPTFDPPAPSSSAVQIRVNALKRTGTALPTFNGTNIESINNQTNGGVLGQLIHGEAFEESVDVDFLGLPTENYVQMYVVLDETRTPHFLSEANTYYPIKWNNIGDKYDFNRSEVYDSYYSAREIQKVGPFRFHGRFIIWDSIPARYQKILHERLNGDRQISRYWRKTPGDDALGRFTLRRGDAYMGRQGQLITRTGGSGEFGLMNFGLNKQGMDIQGGKPYEGVLRVKSNGAESIFLSLRDSEGKILAEKEFPLAGDGSWEKVEFELTPSGSDPKGGFGIALRDNGEVELGYVYLQAGQWGRVEGMPLRKGMVDALKKQGIKTMRYNGSMVDCSYDGHLYRWKKMIGPMDERRVCYRDGFNPYSTHTFGIIEFLELAEAVGAEAMVGMNINENYEDIRDFVEYVNGDVSTKWGALRAAHGHPKPFNLKMIQVHNEQTISEGYVEGMKKFARAAWEVDPQMNIITSLNFYGEGAYDRGTRRYELSVELFKWFIEQGKADRMGWDPHFDGTVGFASDKGYFEKIMGITLQRNLLEDTGHKLHLYPMEENGSRCDWDRGLAHAHNWNALQRYADCFTWLGTANTFQPHKQHYMWDQGRIHYTSDAIWFQPSAYEDEMMSSPWLPVVLESSSSDDRLLDVLAKADEAGDMLRIFVVNLADGPQKAVIDVEGFRPRGKAETWTIGDCELTDYNTVENKTAVAPVTGTVKSGRKMEYTFPRFSYTVITLRK